MGFNIFSDVRYARSAVSRRLSAFERKRRPQFAQVSHHCIFRISATSFLSCGAFEVSNSAHVDGVGGAGAAALATVAHPVIRNATAANSTYQRLGLICSPCSRFDRLLRRPDIASATTAAAGRSAVCSSQVRCRLCVRDIDLSCGDIPRSGPTLSRKGPYEIKEQSAGGSRFRPRAQRKIEACGLRKRTHNLVRSRLS